MNLSRTQQLLYEEAQHKLTSANEMLSNANLFAGKFNSLEVRRALQSAAEAVSVMTELDVILNG